MKRYLPRNRVIESIIEYFVMQHLRADNDHVEDHLVFNHSVIIHSVELLDDDLIVANVEHSLFDEQTETYCRPKFTKVELTAMWPPETVFNIEVES